MHRVTPVQILLSRLLLRGETLSVRFVDRMLALSIKVYLFHSPAGYSFGANAADMPNTKVRKKWSANTESCISKAVFESRAITEGNK